MSTIHPHWQSDEGQPVRITAKQATPQKEMTVDAPMMTSVSRRPAAMAGIGLALMVLFAVFRPDSGGQTVGQVQNSYKIVLTQDGPITDLEVALPGDEIEFLNLFPDPQRLDLSGIPTIDMIGETDPIAFQESYTITLAEPGESDEFFYHGMDSDMIEGSIVIAWPDDSMRGGETFPGESVDEETDVAYAPEEEMTDEDITPEKDPEPTFEELYPYPDEIFATEPVEQGASLALPSADPLPSDETPTYVVQSLPQNPFTVEYGQMHGAPVPPPYEGFTNDAQHAGAPLDIVHSRPISQPSTGAGVWLVIFLSVGTLIAVTHKAFRKM